MIRNLLGFIDEEYVSARELHRKLEVGKEFASWIKDKISSFDFKEGKDYFVSKVNSDDLGRPKIEYLLTSEAACEIIIPAKNDFARRFRKKLAKGIDDITFIETINNLNQERNHV